MIKLICCPKCGHAWQEEKSDIYMIRETKETFYSIKHPHDVDCV